MTNKFQTFNEFPSYENYKFVGLDNCAIGEREELIGADGVGSSLAITLYNAQNKIGILVHILGVETSPDELKPKKVIDTLLRKLNIFGDLDYKKLEATLAGEGIVLAESQRNSPIVRAKLQDYEIPIIGEDLFKGPGRLVFLHCDTGRVEVYRA
ncbi:Chemoreceptor glutamine deamidase CheD [subsurface metagenome]